MQPQDPAPEGRSGRWYALALHSHSRYSDGNRTVADLVVMARKGGLDALAISDHNTLRQTLDPEFRDDRLVLIPAVEWTNPRGPHAGLHGISGTRPVDPTLGASDLFRTARDRGATVVINHPGEPHYSWIEDDISGAHGIEIWNFVWGLRPGLSLGAPLRPIAAHRKRYGFRYALLSLHAMFWDKNALGLSFWQKALETGHKLSPVAGSDFHSRPQRLESPCTLVWAEEATPEALMAALRAGRTTLSTTPAGARALLEADADGDGTFDALPGDTVPSGSRMRLRVEGASGATARIYGPGGLKHRFRVRGRSWSTTFDHAGGDFLWARIDGALPGSLRSIAAPMYFA